ncbi:MAG: sulfur carrier protein ThiS [Thiotrichales bacterium]|nr:sulfur carrier protein ThiS [Thiotrichales bacterium]
MNVIINNENVLLEEAISVAELLHLLGIQKKRIAIEINLEILPRSQYASCTVQENDRIEIVNAVGGG